MERRNWGYPTRSRERAERQLKHDLKFYGAGGPGDCAKLNERHPKIVPRAHRDGLTWYHTEVDDIVLDLELE